MSETIECRPSPKRSQRNSSRVLLGLLLVREGDVAAAREQFQEVLRVDPFQPVARAFVDPTLVAELA